MRVVPLVIRCLRAYDGLSTTDFVEGGADREY